MLSLPDFKQKQIVFVFISYGEKFSFKNDNIIVKDSEGKIRHQSTCYKLFALYIVGHVTVTSGLLQRSERFGFTLIFMSHHLRVYGIWRSHTEGNFLLREKQYRYSSLDIATHIIKNKIENQNHLLRKVRNKDHSIRQSIERLDIFKENLNANQFGVL